jgi:phosphonate transport system permease protein
VFAIVLVFLVLSWKVVSPDGFRVLNFIDFLGKFKVAPQKAYMPKLASRMGETLLLAWTATVWACIISFPLSIWAARVTTPGLWSIPLVRAFFALVRAVPDLLLALILASAVGLGPIPGVIALVVSSVGFLVKNYADVLDVVDRHPIDGVTSTGADWLAVRSISVLPQAAPDLMGLSLYQLDTNVRTSAILGAVGAGGIGYDLTQSMKLFQFDRLGPIILAIYLSVTLIDRVSGFLRRKLS